MLSENCWALKEWAVVCAALATGRQTILLRKGGVAEGPGGFAVAHPEFWLLPTQFHQTAEQLRPDSADLLKSTADLTPPDNRLRIDLYARVRMVSRIDREAELPALVDRQVLSADTVRERFHYRTPGLFLLTLQVDRRAQPYIIADHTSYAGCRSWVELKDSLTTTDLIPIPSDNHTVQSGAPVGQQSTSTQGTGP